MLMQNKFLSRLIKEFEQLNKVPKFQIERAISPLLGIFIKEIVNKKLNVSVSVSFPEFPLKHEGDNQSTNIDWLLVDRKNKTLYFIELKTDNLSYNSEQFGIYKKFKDDIEKDKNAIILELQLNSIIPKTRRKDKYKSILRKLNEYKVDLSLYPFLKIVYIAPDKPDESMNIVYDDLILLRNLPAKIKTRYIKEWHQLRKFLKTLSTQYDKK